MKKRNLATQRRQSNNRKARLREQIDKIKNSPCVDCKQSYPPVCMDFDHRDPASKLASISELVSHGKAMNQIMIEIQKCDLVCSNCHRIRTHIQRDPLISHE